MASSVQFKTAQSRSFEVARRLLVENPERQGTVALGAAALKELVAAAANQDAAASSVPATQVLRDVFDQLAGPGWGDKVVASASGTSLASMIASNRAGGLGFEIREPSLQWNAINAAELKKGAPAGAAEWIDRVVARGGPVTGDDVRSLASAIFPPDGDARWKKIDSDDFRWAQTFRSPGWVPMTDDARKQFDSAVNQALALSARTPGHRAWTMGVIERGGPVTLADARDFVKTIPKRTPTDNSFYGATAYADSIYATLPMTPEARVFFDVLSNMGLPRTTRDAYGIEDFVNLQGPVELFAVSREAGKAYRDLGGG